MAKPNRTRYRLNDLSDRQRLFVSEYLKDRKARAAAIRAGYSEKNSANAAGELMADPRVVAAIDEGIKRIEERNAELAQRLIDEVARIATFDLRSVYGKDGKLCPPHEMDEDAGHALASIETEGHYDREVGAHYTTNRVRLWDKIAACRLLADHLGIAKQRLEHSAEAGGGMYQIVDPYAEPPPGKRAGPSVDDGDDEGSDE